MAQTRREIELFVNVPERKFVISDTDGGAYKTPVKVGRNEQVLFKFHLLDDAADPNYITIPASSTWDFGIDNDYTPGHADHVTSVDADFNIEADWPTVQDPDNGFVCVRVDLNTTELETEMASAASKNMQMCVYYTPPGSDSVLAFQLPITITGVVVEASPAAANPADTFPTKAVLASTANGDGASLIGIEDSGALITATTVEGALAELAAASGGGGLSKQGTITSDADAGEGIYTLDASGGAFNFTLPAATGAQTRYIFFTGDTETNAATIAVQTGEALNGVTNDTHILDRNLQAVLAVDTGTGDWVLSNITESAIDFVGFNIDGGGSVITAASVGYTTIPFDCVLLAVYIISTYNETGSITLDFWADVQANYPPTNADTITNANEPAIVAAQVLTDTDITNWTNTRRKRGDVLAVNVDSVATFTGVEVKLLVLKG